MRNLFWLSAEMPRRSRYARAAFAAPKTLIKPLRRIDRERRRLFLVKRAARHPVRSLFLQIRRIRLYYPDQIGPVFEIVDEVLGVEHINAKQHVKLEISWDRK